MKCFRCTDWPCTCKDGCTIIHGDSLQVLKEFETNSLDCVVTDPPWKASTGRRTNRRLNDSFGVAKVYKKIESLAYGDIGYFSPEILKEVRRIAKADMLVQCGYMELAEVLQLAGKVRGVFVWHNTRPTPIPGPVKVRNVYFFVWGTESTTVTNSTPWKSCLFSYASPQGGCMATERIRNLDGSTAHPSQEPIRLYRDIITPLSGTILEPYLGTGTTMRAAKDLGKNCIGIEIEEKYCTIAAERLRQEVLF